MNKNLQDLIKRSNKVAEEREARRTLLLDNIAAAEAELGNAEAVKQAANDAESYANASERVRRAADVLEFYQGALNVLNAEKTMTQDEYDDSQAIIRSCAENAAEAFRKRADKITAQLVTAYGEYSQAIEDANSAAVALSKAADLPQSEHVMHYGLLEQRDMFVGYKRSSLGGYTGGDPVRRHTWNLLSAQIGLAD